MLKDTQHRVHGSVRVVECTEACVSLIYFPDGSGAAWFRCAEGRGAFFGVLVDERNLVTDGFKRRGLSVADVQWSASSPVLNRRRNSKARSS